MEKSIYNYLTTNIINKKQYIGMHIGELTDEYLGSGVLILKAIKKYGKNNFIKEVLEICDTVEIAYNNEEKYIKQYNTVAPNGYNLSPAGGMQIPQGWSNESRKKQSIKLKGNTNKKGKKTSDITKEKLSKSCKDKKRSEITKQRMRKPRTDKNKENIRKGIINWWQNKKNNTIKYGTLD